MDVSQINLFYLTKCVEINEAVNFFVLYVFKQIMKWKKNVPISYWHPSLKVWSRTVSIHHRQFWEYHIYTLGIPWLFLLIYFLAIKFNSNLKYFKDKISVVTYNSISSIVCSLIYNRLKVKPMDSYIKKNCLTCQIKVNSPTNDGPL